MRKHFNRNGTGRNLMISLLVFLMITVVFVTGRQSPVEAVPSAPEIVLGSATLDNGTYYFQNAAVTGSGIRTLLLNFSSRVTAGDEIILPVETGFNVSASSTVYTKRVSLDDNVTLAMLQDYIRRIGFTISSESQTIDATITTESVAYDTYYHLDTQHYYQYIPDSDKNWIEAYDSARSMTYMGRTGYLATITSLQEDEFVNAVSGGKTGWLGGTILSPAGDAPGSPLHYAGFNTAAVTASGWYWACGPEKGQIFYNATSLYPSATAGHAAEVDTGNPSTYYNWARGSQSYEPNNQTSYVSSGNTYETCLTTLKIDLNIGKQGTAFSWNDRGVEGAGSGDWDAKGYFVEYGDSILGDSLPDRSGDTFASDSSLLRRPSGEISLTTSDWMDAATYTCDIVLPPTAEMVTLSVDSGSFSIPSLGGVLTFLGGTAGTDYVQYFSAAETFSSAVFSFTDVLAAQDVLNTIRFTADTLRRQTVTATSSTVSPLDGDMYFDGHFYRYIAGTTDWPTAVLEASTLPDPYFGGRGYSVTVTSQAENSILLRLVRNGSGWYRAWLGGLWQRNSGSLSEPVIIRDTDGHELTISDLADTDRHLTLLKDYSIHYGTANGGDFIDGALTPIHGSSDKVQFYWIDGPEAGEEIANNTAEFSPWHVNSGQVQDEPNSGDFVYIGWGGAYWDDLGAFPSDSGTTYDRRDGYLVEFSGFDGGTTDGVIREASIDVLPAPVITGITPGDQTLSVSFSVSDPSADSIEYSLDNGLNWTAVSPISTVSPLVLSGLTNGTDYAVKIRMISQGTPGLESNMMSGRPLGTQTINFPVLGTARYGDADFDPGASASSGLAITYSSSNPQVAIIDNQQISIVGAGTATITASQSGDSEWGAAADQSQELTVLPYHLVISNFTAADKIYDGTTHAMYSYQTNQLIGDDLAIDVTVAFASKDVTYVEPVSGILRNNEVTLTVNRLTGSDASNYVLAMSTLTTTATITPKLLTITGMSVDDKYYDRSMDATISGGSLIGIVSDDDVRLTVGDAVFAYRDAGNSIPVFADMYLQGSDADNYSLQSPDLHADIRPRPVRIVVAGAQDKVYDGTDEATLYGVHVTGVLSGDDARLLNSSRGYFSRSSPGYDLLVFPDLHLVGGEAGNYVIDHFDVVQASITPRPLTIAARSDTKLYGHDDPRLYYTSIGFAPGESMSNLTGSLTVSRQPGEDVGDYSIYLTSSLTSPNYTITLRNGTLTINPQIIMITAATAQNKVYDGTSIATVSGAVMNGVLEKDIDQVSLIRDQAGQFVQSEVGQALRVETLMQLIGDQSGNYVIQQPVLQADILARPITVTADAVEKIYGNPDPELSWQITEGSLVGDDQVSGELIREFGETVGTYAIGQNTLTAGDNYDLTYVGADLTVTPRLITVTADAVEKIYSNPDPELNWQITEGSLVGDDQVSGELIRDPGETVGTYTIGQNTLTAGDNYDLTYVGADLTVTPRPITVTAEAVEKIYGNPDPELSWQITEDLAGDDQLVGELFRESGETVGTYAIGQNTLTAGDNYDLTYVDADLTVTPRLITVTAEAVEKIYGNPDPELSWQITEGTLAGDDQLVGELFRESGETVGTYAIGQNTLTAGDNYDLTYVDADLTVTPRLITVTAEAVEKIYGNPDPELSWQITEGSLAGDDQLVGELIRDPGETVGTYTIGQNTLTAGDNYDLTYVDADLVIRPYEALFQEGAVRNGMAQQNDGSISYVATSNEGYGFAYWSNGHTVVWTQPELINPTGGISRYHPILWPMSPSTDKKAFMMSKTSSTQIDFLGGSVSMTIPAHDDPEAVIAVTGHREFSSEVIAPPGMMNLNRYFNFLRSENLIDQRIRFEIDLDSLELELDQDAMSSLMIYRWDETLGLWEKESIISQGLDLTRNIIWAETDHFSTYGLFAASDEISQTGESSETPWYPLVFGAVLTVAVLIRRRFRQD